MGESQSGARHVPTEARWHRLGQRETHRGVPRVMNVEPQDGLAAQNLSPRFSAFKWRCSLFSPPPFFFLQKLEPRPSHFATGKATQSERMTCGKRRDGEGGCGCVGPKRVGHFAPWAHREHWPILLVPLIFGVLDRRASGVASSQIVHAVNVSLEAKCGLMSSTHQGFLTGKVEMKDLDSTQRLGRY